MLWSNFREVWQGTLDEPADVEGVSEPGNSTSGMVSGEAIGTEANPPTSSRGAGGSGMQGNEAGGADEEDDEDEVEDDGEDGGDEEEEEEEEEIGDVGDAEYNEEGGDDDNDKDGVEANVGGL